MHVIGTSRPWHLGQTFQKNLSIRLGTQAWITQYQLPRAVINLKQGVGRLIRDRNDRGVLVLCDPRLRTRAYGKIFLKSLPEMPGTCRADDVHEFFASSVTSRAEPLVS